MSLNKTARKILKYILFFALMFIVGAILGVGVVLIGYGVSKYHYSGELYSDSLDYKNNYGYNYFKENNKNQEELYIELYHVAVDFTHQNKNLAERFNYGYGILYKKNAKDTNLSFDELFQVFIVFERENPQFYFIETKYNPVRGYVQFEIKEEYLKAKERNRINTLIDEKMEEVDNLVSACSTTYDIVTTVSDYIISKMTYARDENNDPSNEAWAHNIVGFFERGEGVCETYSETFTYMLNRYGVESVPAWSSTHGWNIVKIDGYNYIYDLTNKVCGYDEKTYQTYMKYQYEDSMYPVYNMGKSKITDSLLTLKEDEIVIASSHSMDYIMSLFNNKDYEIDVQNDKNNSIYLSEINTSYKTLTFKSTGTYGVNIFLYDDLVINKDVTFYNLLIDGLSSTLYINNATINAYGYGVSIGVDIVGDEHSTINLDTITESLITETINVDTLISSRPLTIRESANISNYIGDYLYIYLSIDSQVINIDKYEANKIAIYAATSKGNTLTISNVSITSPYFELYYIKGTDDTNISVDINFTGIRVIRQ
ncbi:MAG: hypothetical protein K6F59_04805 [Gammaproteobacteria bacterium]|nr:hypothetical protein [Gammaproteobacteria bacterium]